VPIRLKTDRELARLTARPAGGARPVRAPARAAQPGPAPPPPAEADVQRAVVSYLVLCGCLVVRVNGGMLPNPAGRRVRFSRVSALGAADGELTSSDLIVLTPTGCYLGVEVKRPGETPTAGQSRFLAAVEARGGVGVVVSSVDEARAALKAAGRVAPAGPGGRSR
jgi:hypothetical protein